MKSESVFAAAAAFVSLALAGVAWPAPKYSIIDVGPASSVEGFNNKGEILGTDAAGQPFTFQHGARSNIVVPAAIINACTSGYIGNLPAPGNGYAGAINDDGDIALTVYDFPYPPDLPYCVVLYRRGEFSIITNPVYSVYQITGIDGADDVIYNTYEPISPIDQGGGASCTLPPNSQRLSNVVNYNGINNRGAIVGASFAFLGGTTNNPAAMVCRNGTIHVYKSLGGSSSQASAINDFGRATGYVTTKSGITHVAVFDDDDRTVDIGALSKYASDGSQGTSINDFDEIVGMAEFTEINAIQPFVSYRHKVYRLATLIDQRDPLRPYVQLSPFGSTALINNDGDIAITGSDSRTGVEHIYILHPHDDDYRYHDE